MVISPETRWVPKWGAVTTIALLFTAIFTPYETALLPTKLDALFFINRLVDLIFACDLVRSARSRSSRAAPRDTRPRERVRALLSRTGHAPR